jgi:hypothetical protein
MVFASLFAMHVLWQPARKVLGREGTLASTVKITVHLEGKLFKVKSAGFFYSRPHNGFMVIHWLWCLRYSQEIPNAQLSCHTA